MPIIRQRKKNLILAGLVGGGIMGIPLLIGFIVVLFGNLAAHQQIKNYEEQLAEQKRVNLYVLKSDKEKGEIIEKSDLRLVEVNGKNINFSPINIEEIVGKTSRLQLKRDTVMNVSLVQKGALPTDDMRKISFSYIDIPLDLKVNDYVDVRITFPNGEDYIVVEQKKVLELSENTQENQTIPLLGICVTEEELLKLSSAKVDLEVFSGTRVYAVQYMGEYQEKAATNYPLNQFVYEQIGWNPNIKESKLDRENSNHRESLEQNLIEFMSN
ncbi:MAG: hypothetical protein GX913_02635 [Clostridiales bacterium]|nr:hypothetical protein [Clostridiales bacterium]